jgi:hypothetical protein
MHAYTCILRLAVVRYLLGVTAARGQKVKVEVASS